MWPTSPSNLMIREGVIFDFGRHDPGGLLPLFASDFYSPSLICSLSKCFSPDLSSSTLSRFGGCLRVLPFLTRKDLEGASGGGAMPAVRLAGSSSLLLPRLGFSLSLLNPSRQTKKLFPFLFLNIIPQHK